MVNAMPLGLRTCLRATPSRALRCERSLPQRRCLAVAACLERNGNRSYSALDGSASTPTRATYLTRLRWGGMAIGTGSGRGYSTRDGTIARGAAGAEEVEVVEEAEEKVPREVLRAPDHLSESEKDIWELLNRELGCVKLEVQDISGGCGSMYGIEIVSERFQGLGMLKQQRLVNDVLGEKIKGWHGVQLKTSAP